MRCGFREIAGDGLREELGDRRAIAHDHALKPALLAQISVKQRAVRGHWNAGDAGKGRHDRHATGSNRGVEGRQIDFMQAALGDIHRSIVAASLRRAIGAEMFGGRAD